MNTLLIASGNPLRGDDGVAHEVLRFISPGTNHTIRSVQQLTPELAEEIAGFSRVVFIDADVERKALAIEQVCRTVTRSQLTHASSPEEIVDLASALFGFSGQAFVCRIPARDFSAGEAPTREALQSAREAAVAIGGLIQGGGIVD